MNDFFFFIVFNDPVNIEELLLLVDENQYTPPVVFYLQFSYSNAEVSTKEHCNTMEDAKVKVMYSI